MSLLDVNMPGVLTRQELEEQVDLDHWLLVAHGVLVEMIVRPFCHLLVFLHQVSPPTMFYFHELALPPCFDLEIGGSRANFFMLVLPLKEPRSMGNVQYRRSTGNQGDCWRTCRCSWPKSCEELRSRAILARSYV